jgi:ubiquitin-conjugating enzyme E2 A
MKEYVRRVKATVEESWLDPGEEIEEDDNTARAST